MFFHMMFTDMYVTVVEIATVTNIYTNAFFTLKSRYIFYYHSHRLFLSYELGIS